MPNRCTVHLRTVVDVVADFVKYFQQHGSGEAARVHVEAARMVARDDPQAVVHIDGGSVLKRSPDVEEF